MPIFEYECLKCGKRTEKLQRGGEVLLNACPDCGGEVTRLVSAPMIQFKGSGWYITDYQKKDKQTEETANAKPKSSDTVKTSSGAA